VVIYDHLAAPELLDMVREDCRLIDAGKSGSAHTLSQEQINELLVTEGKAGRIVVRLKGGDPYIFGRGAEEALELKKAGIPFEVIPGVSSAVAAASTAGIPLTHRSLASQVAILTGHEKPGKEQSAHHWPSLAKMGTLAMVMSSKNLSYLTQKLLEAGKDPKTPAAVIQWGSTTRQKVVTAPLSELAKAAKEANLGPPSLLVVGEVVNLREDLNWFEKRSLWGRRILVTRTRSQAGQLTAGLIDRGAEVLEKPVIKIVPISPNPALTAALENLSDYQWLIFTSPNGASIFVKSLFNHGFDSRALKGIKIAVLGPGTAQALTPYGLKPDLTPTSFIAEGLVSAFKGVPAGRCLLARAETGRDILIKGLSELGFKVDEVHLYKTIPAAWTLRTENPAGPDDPGNQDSSGSPESLEEFCKNPPDLTTLTSASTARGLASIIPQDYRASFEVVSLGPITSQAAVEEGFKVVAESPRATIDDLIQTITEYFGGRET
jgi:uroporphyrinogen III methyltransferase/synthase